MESGSQRLSVTGGHTLVASPADRRLAPEQDSAPPWPTNEVSLVLPLLTLESQLCCMVTSGPGSRAQASLQDRRCDMGLRTHLRCGPQDSAPLALVPSIGIHTELLLEFPGLRHVCPSIHKGRC